MSKDKTRFVNVNGFGTSFEIEPGDSQETIREKAKVVALKMLDEHFDLLVTDEEITDEPYLPEFDVVVTINYKNEYVATENYTVQIPNPADSEDKLKKQLHEECDFMIRLDYGTEEDWEENNYSWTIESYEGNINLDNIKL